MIAAKVANALALDYPRERLQIDRRLRRLHRRHRRARPRRRRRPRPRAAARRQGRRPQRRRRAARPASCSPSPTPTAPGRPTPCAAWSSPSPTPRVGYVCGQVRFVDAGGDNLEGAYWRYEMAVREMESALAGITAGNGAIYAVRRERLPAARPLRQPRPLLPLRAGQARPALALRAGGAGRGEDGPDHGGRVRPQTADDGRALGHRRRRRHGLPARLLAALRLRARLAPAAALPQPGPAPASSSPPTSPCSARARSTSSPSSPSWR